MRCFIAKPLSDLRTTAAAAIAGTMLLAAPHAFAVDERDIVTYSAEYEVRYNGRRVASAIFSVVNTDGGFIFESSARARGLLRLASPNAAIEQSVFVIENRAIAPLRFAYEDGSRKGEDNYTIVFDRNAGQIRVSGASGSRSLELEPVLDRGSMQVALMTDLDACRHPGPYRLVDDEDIKTYVYERLEDAEIETEMGVMTAERYLQRREGSSRTTIVSAAPALRYLPVRIEQLRDGEVETVFTLVDADLGDSALASGDEHVCSSLR